jgi:glycosyltransferase involved in cell wall biosynthesis
MRVLHVVPSFYPAVGYGGPIYSLLHLCLNLKAVGCDVNVLTTDAHGKIRLTSNQQRDPMLSPLNVQFCPRVGKGSIAPQLAKSLSREIRRADVVHLTAVYNFPTLPTLFLARRYSKPLVWSPRGTLQRWAGSRRVHAKNCWDAACRRVLPRRAALHVTSQQEASESASRLNNLPAWVIPNGIDIPNWPPPPPNNGVLRLLFLGRLDPKKGIENLIRATALLLNGEIRCNWRLTIAGGGDPKYVAQLRSLASEASITRSIEFCGQIEGEEKYRAYTNADIVIVPSYTENFGVVVAEALAHARAVIASRGTPWREIEDRGCGVWVENDPASLAAAIEQLAARDRAAMGQRGREWMQESFSWRERARSMLSLYEHLLAT